MKTYPKKYQRNLPHIHPVDAPLFITYRLAGSLPEPAIKFLKWKREEMTRLALQNPDPIAQNDIRSKIKRKIFIRYDQLLDSMETGPLWLREPDIAEILMEAIHYRHPAIYELICFSVMPNHVHQIFMHKPGKVPVCKILNDLKSFTGHTANKVLKRVGNPFWQRESFDHVIRSGKMPDTVSYVLNNPVQAGLARHWREWPYHWLNPDYENLMVD